MDWQTKKLENERLEAEARKGAEAAKAALPPAPTGKPAWQRTAPEPVKWEPPVCEHCGQATAYLLPLDRGTADIVKAFATAVRNKGMNTIHPGNEMEVPAREWTQYRSVTEGVLTSNQIGNFTRARIHGLLARLEGEAGNWLLTKKGAAFLRGQAVPRYAIVKKTTAEMRSHKDEYYEPDTETITIFDLLREDDYWHTGMADFEIVEGRVIAA